VLSFSLQEEDEDDEYVWPPITLSINDDDDDGHGEADEGSSVVNKDKGDKGKVYSSSCKNKAIELLKGVFTPQNDLYFEEFFVKFLL